MVDLGRVSGEAKRRSRSRAHAGEGEGEGVGVGDSCLHREGECRAFQWKERELHTSV